MSKADIIPIIDSKDLVRDTASKAVLQTNHQKLIEHREKKKLLGTFVNHGKEINDLKRDVSDIKSMLEKIVASLNDK